MNPKLSPPKTPKKHGPFGQAKEKAEREKRQLAKLRKEFRYQAAPPFGPFGGGGLRFFLFFL